MDLDTGFAQNITIDQTNMVSSSAIAQMKQRLSEQGLDNIGVQRREEGLKLLDETVNQPSAAHSAALRVFISHASPDSMDAQHIAKALGEVGVDTWLASRDVKAGQNFAESIIEAIEKSTHLLVLLTEDSLKSPHVKREVNHAIDQQKALLPVFRNVPIDVKSALPSDWRYWLGIAQAIVWDQEADIGQNLKRHLTD
jgi:phosphoribosyl-ATP pyrophosphohydrolase